MKKEKQKQVFCSNMVYYRKKRGITQEQLGQALGVHRTYICAIERGRENPTLRVILDVAETLKIDPCYLFIDRKRMG